MQNQCFELQGSGCPPEVGGEASPTDLASGHSEAVRAFQPLCGEALVNKHSKAFNVKRIKSLFVDDHIFRLSLLLAPKMVTHAIMEGELSTSAVPAGDNEQSELLSLTVNGPEDDCLRSPDSVASILPVTTVNTNLLSGTVNETYEGSIKDGSVDLDDKDHSDIILTVDGEDNGNNEASYISESLRSLVFQIFIPFLIAGCGTVAAGIVLDIVQMWPVFKTVKQLFILVPALLGLKGNLEMTLAARISTQANLGQLDNLREQWKMTYGNMALVQCQATVVAFLAAIFAVVVDIISEKKFDLNDATLICASSLITASVASLILGFITVGVVLLSRKVHINPDNVATPIAASLGDVTTLALLASIGNALYNVSSEKWIAPLFIIVFLLMVPLWVVIALRSKYTRQVLYSGWVPVISAVFISSAGGCVLDMAIEKFPGIAVYQPVINGVGGNLVAVQASKISTYLHQMTQMGTLPVSESRACINPFSAFFGKTPSSRSARVLLLMTVPGHIIFVTMIYFIKPGHTAITPLFLALYLSFSFIQVACLLYIAYCMIQWMWRRKIDPDNSAIPYLTAFGDLLGTSLLALGFFFMFYVGDKGATAGD